MFTTVDPGSRLAEFDLDTRVTRTSEGQFTGMVDAGWSISGNPNGGYLLSLISAAIAQVLPHPDPLTFTAHYLRPGVAGAICEITVDVVRTGRTLSTVRAVLFQEGKQRVEVLAAYADFGVSAGVHADISLDAPELPPPDQCIPRTGDLQGIDIAMLNKLDIRLHPDQAVPGGAGIPEVSGGFVLWISERLIPGRCCFFVTPFPRLHLVSWGLSAGCRR